MNNIVSISLNTLLLLAFCLILAVICIVQVLKIRRLHKLHAVSERRQKELETKINTLELADIKYKLNPHLFKNTLNSIQSHAYQTYYALDKLSSVLDYLLYESDKPYVSLEDELEFALNLIEINRIKVSPLFDLRIKSKINTENPFFSQQLIAPLLTIDLIENAFKHADLQSEEAFISIVFELTEDKFLLTVSNKISAKPSIKKEKSGFGKKNSDKRLAIIYAENYSLDNFIEEDVYIAHLKINLIEHKAKMLAAGR